MGQQPCSIPLNLTNEIKLDDSGDCLPIQCLTEFLKLNPSQVEPFLDNTTVTYVEAEKRVEVTYRLVNKADNTSLAGDDIPSGDCFDVVLEDLNFTNSNAPVAASGSMNFTNTDEFDQVKFSFPVETIPDLCEDIGGNQYTCRNIINYNTLITNEDFYEVHSSFTIQFGDAKNTVSNIIVNSTDGANTGNSNNTITIPATLTRWNENFVADITADPPADNSVKIGEKIFVKLIADQDTIRQHYKFTFKSAQFIGPQIQIPIRSADVEQGMSGFTEGADFELELTIKAAYPGDLQLEVVGQVENKRVRFLAQQEGLTRVGRGKVDIVVSEDRVQDLDDKKKGTIEDGGEGQDTLTIVLIIMASIIGIMVPGAIVFSIIKYKKLMSEKQYQEEMYRNERSAISDIQSQNTITQGADQPSNLKNNALQIHV